MQVRASLAHLSFLALASASMLPPAVGDAMVMPHATVSPMLGPGQAYSVTFATAGEFAYHCHIHPGMVGRVEVQAPARGEGPRTSIVHLLDDGQASHLGNMSFRDDSLGSNVTVVRVGDTVTWVNGGALMHDVALSAAAAAPAPNDPGVFEAAVAAVALAAVAGIVAIRLRRP